MTREKIDENKNDEIIKYNKFKKVIYFLLTVIVIVVIVIFIYMYYQEWTFNQSIISCKNSKVELNNIKELNLWDITLQNLKNNDKYIEVSYDDYKVKLDTKKLQKRNIINIDVKKKESSYQDFKNLNILEIDLLETESNDLIDQIEIDAKTLLDGLKMVDIYGIKESEMEFIETKEIEESNITISTKEDYKEFILVYVPIKEIQVEKDEIEIYKNETYQLKLNVNPPNATYKSVHIDDLDENSIVQIREDGVIQANKTGTQEISITAEDGKVEKKITVNVKARTEGIEVESDNIEMIKGETKEIKAKILPEEVEDKTLKYEISDEEIVTVDENGKIEAKKEGDTIITILTNAEPVQKRQIHVTVKKEQKITETEVENVQVESNNSEPNAIIAGNYINGVLVVNKNYQLPSNYNPGTNHDAMQAFNYMREKAAQEGISLKIVSGFRSYQTQQAIYQRNVQAYGEEIANTFSAKPGQSEHQTGLAFDVNSTRWDFKDTTEGKWLASNCYKYGFIIRYPEGKEDITGYVYEPWHIRYVGNSLAMEIYNSGLCLEEYLGMTQN